MFGWDGVGKASQYKPPYFQAPDVGMSTYVL